MKWYLLIGAVAATTIFTATTHAQAVDPILYESAVFGINRRTGLFTRYDFDHQVATNIGTVHWEHDGSDMLGIDAAAYMPGFQNIFAFWTDPSDNKTKLLYVDTETGKATIVGNPLEGGRITGAVAVLGSRPYLPNVSDHDDDRDEHGEHHGDHDDDRDEHGEHHGDHDDDHDEHGEHHGDHDDDDDGDRHGERNGDDDDDKDKTIVAVQVNQADPLLDTSGLININPSNSPTDEFTLTTEAGQVFTRDDLHQDSPADDDGTFYQGRATRICMKPKGNGYQNGLLVDGQTYPLSNGKTYNLIGDMTVRIYNDHVLNNGKAMGHWWVQINSGRALFVDDTDDDNEHADHDDDRDEHGEHHDDHDDDHDEHGEHHADHDDDDDHEHADHDDDDDDDDSHNESTDLDLTGEPQLVSRLIQIDHRTGSVTELMTLSRPYDSLASADGTSFYAAAGNDLYLIDPLNHSETLIASLGDDNFTAQEFIGSSLMGFGIDQDVLTPYDSSGQQTGSPAALGMYDLGTIVFMPLVDDPAASPDAFD